MTLSIERGMPSLLQLVRILKIERIPQRMMCITEGSG
jgi:hypothetical protein